MYFCTDTKYQINPQNIVLNIMRKNILFIIIALLLVTASCKTSKESSAIISLETTYGKIKVRLYPETPNHRKNFLKLVNKGFYDGVLFHRVIADFMIQTGDPDSKNAKSGGSLGSGDVGYTIPAEFIYPKYYHKRGALAAAREGDQANPLQASSGCQFYIVEGKIFTDSQLDSIERNNEHKLETKLFQEIVNKRQDEVKQFRLEGSQLKLDALRDSILAEVHTHMKNHPTYKLTKQQRADYKMIG